MNRRRRIVLVEDDDSLRTIAQLSLETIGGHEVFAFASGEKAIAGAAELDPDLLVLDVLMPGLTGPQTLQALRLQPALAMTPAMFLTASTQAAQVSSYLALGAVDVVAKPFDPSHLCDRVAAVLDGRGKDTVEPARAKPAALVVEDDASVRYLVRFILEQEGWDVHEAGTGTEGAHAIDDGPVADAVLLDIMLPEIDGLDLLDRLRGNARWTGVPVMMLTARGDEAAVRRALAAGANDYLAKPFDPSELASRLSRLPRRATR